MAIATGILEQELIMWVKLLCISNYTVSSLHGPEEVLQKKWLNMSVYEHFWCFKSPEAPGTSVGKNTEYKQIFVC